MGRVLDLYWKYGDAQDCFCGRTLAGLPCDSPNFDILPPHFVYEDSEAKDATECIEEGIELCFGEQPRERLWLYSRLLPNLVYHMDFINCTVSKDPQHPFASIPLRQNVALLQKLKKMVTTKPSKEMMTPTGVPPVSYTHLTLPTKA